MRRKKFNQNKQLSGVLSVSLEDCKGNVDLLVRRFIKKVKKEGVVEEYRSRTHYKKDSDIKREKRNELQRRIRKENKQKAELFNMTRGSRKPSRRRR
jgi:ribosomal protein S21